MTCNITEIIYSIIRKVELFGKKTKKIAFGTLSLSGQLGCLLVTVEPGFYQS